MKHNFIVVTFPWFAPWRNIIVQADFIFLICKCEFVFPLTDKAIQMSSKWNRNSEVQIQIDVRAA